MTNKLAYQISRDLGSLSCQLHHMNISTSTSKETTVIKVCCGLFRDDVFAALNKKFGAAFVTDNIRFSLPMNEVPNVTSGKSTEE